MCTRTRFNSHFLGKPGLAVSPLILSWVSSWDRPKLSTSPLTQTHQVFGRPLWLVPLVASTCIAWPSLHHLYVRCFWTSYLPLLFAKLTGFSLYNPLHSVVYFVCFKLKTPIWAYSFNFYLSLLDLRLHCPNFTAMNQTTSYRTCMYFTFRFLTRILL